MIAIFMFYSFANDADAIERVYFDIQLNQSC